MGIWQLWCICGGVLSEAAKDEEVVELDPFAVEARNGETAMELVTAGVNVLEMGDTGRQAAGSLGEALAWEPGVSSSFYGAGASRPVIRGMEGYRVGVYDSGLSTGDLSANSPDHAVAIEPLFIRTVTVHRGAAALLHGGGAIGGAVDTAPDFIPERETPSGWTGEAGAIYETVNDGRTGYLKAGYREAALAVRLNLLERRTEDYGIPGLARTAAYDINNRIRLPPNVQGQVAPNPKGVVPNTWTKTRAGGAGLAWLEDERSVQGAYQRYESTYGVPLDGHTHGNPFGLSGVTGPGPNDGVAIEMVQDRFIGQGQIRIDGEFLKRVEAKGALTGFRQMEHEGRFLSNDFQLDSRDFQLESYGERGRLSGYAGLAYAGHDFKNRNLSYTTGQAEEDTLETSSTLWAAFGLAQLAVRGGAKARLGVRVERQDAQRDDLTGFNRTDTASSVVGEWIQPVAGLWQVVLSLGNTARIPNPDELYIEAPHGATGVYQLPNPDLAMERSRSAEVRIENRGQRLRLTAGAFYRAFDGFIFLENQGYEVDGLTAYALVQREARFLGGELEAEWRFSPVDGLETTVSAFADYVRATDEERGQPLPRIPPLRMGMKTDFTRGLWSGSIHALHVFEQDRVPREVFGTLAYQSPSDAYTLLTLRLERRLEFDAVTALATIQVSNLLDEEARQHTSFLKDVAPLPGRSLQLRLMIEF